MTIQHRGKLIDACSLAGETRADGWFPGHINGLQLSADRFLLLYSTRGWRGTDDNTSIIYQVRDGAYDGPVLEEGCFARTSDHWDALGDDSHYVQSHLHPVAFGVPAGARLDGTPLPGAGHFVAMWGRHARRLDPRSGLLADTTPELTAQSTAVEWLQFRLADAANRPAASDSLIEVTVPRTLLRERGYLHGYRFSSAPAVAMGQTYTPPVPLTTDGTEWLGFNAFDGGRVGALRFVQDPESGDFAWTQTGALVGNTLFEPSPAPWGDGYVVSARTQPASRAARGGPIAWSRWEDPFGPGAPELVFPRAPFTQAPLTTFRCADGVLRLLTGDPGVSPYGHPRNPLYVWDIDPEAGFACGPPRVVFDAVAAGVPFREQARFTVDQAKVLPHAGGDRQLIAHRVRPVATNDPAKVGVPVNQQEQAAAGIYYAELRYDQPMPPLWQLQ